MFLSQKPVGPLRPKPKQVRRANPIQDARKAIQASKRAAEQKAAADEKKKEIRDNNANVKKREKDVDLVALQYEISPLKLPRSWLAPEWPYSKEDTARDVDMSLSTVDSIVMKSSQIPREFLDVQASCIKEPGEFLPNRTFDVNVHRIFGIAPNGAQALTRVHGLKEPFAVKLSKSLSRQVLTAVFDHDDTFLPLCDVQGPSSLLLSPHADCNTEEDVAVAAAAAGLDGPQGPQSLQTRKYMGNKEFVETFNNKAERDRRDDILNKHDFSIQVCREAQIELERRLSLDDSLRWKTGDFHHAMVTKVQLKTRQCLMEYDFDEQEVYMEFTLAFPDLIHKAREILSNDGLTMQFERHTFQKSDFYNFKFNSSLNLLVQQKLSGQSWFTLPAGKYKAVYGQLPLEQRHDFAERTIDDTAGATSQTPSLKGTTPDTWYRAEFDIRYEDLISHHNSKEARYNVLAPLRAVYWDLEVETPPKGFPRAGNPDPDPDKYDKGCRVLTISLDFELQPGKIVQGILTWKSEHQTWTEPIDMGPDIFVWEFNNEEEMLQGWVDFVRNCQPSMHGGHNVAKFDIPFLLDRAFFLGMNNFPLWTPLKQFSRIVENLFESKARGQEMTHNPSIPGCSVMDTYHWARNEKKYPSNTLNYVAYKILGKTKDDVHYSQINGLFHGTREQKTRLCYYNLKDSSLPREIVAHQQIIFQQTEIARVTGITIEMYNVRGQGVKTESRLLRLVNAFGFLIPYDKTAGKTPEELDEERKELASRSAVKNTLYQHGMGGISAMRGDSLKTDEEVLAERKARQAKYEGATCLNPRRGFYIIPISVLDFASLYPSIMDAFNLCIAGNGRVLVRGMLTRRIDALHSNIGTSLLSFDQNCAGMVHSNMSNWMSKGKKATIQLTFQDGKTLICTPDHKVLVQHVTTGKQEWVEAQHTAQTDDLRVVSSFDGPLDEPGVDPLEKDWKLSTSLFDLSLSSSHDLNQRDRTLAFARILGFIYADGFRSKHIYGDDDVSVNVDSKMDRLALIDDIRLIMQNKNLHIYSQWQPETGEYTVRIPTSLSKLLIQILGTKESNNGHTTFPDFVLHPACPLAIVREFVGGVFGSRSGVTARIHSSSSSFHFVGVKYVCPSSSSSSPVSNLHTEWMSTLAHLCARLGVEGGQVHNDTNETRMHFHAGGESGEKVWQFSDKIGFRYSYQKSYRAAIAASWSHVTNMASTPIDAEEYIASMGIQQIDKIAWNRRMDNHHLPTFYKKVIDIRPAGERDVYDISVDKTHSFVTNGAVVHNCYSTIIRDKSKLSRLNPEDYTIVRCDRKDEQGNVKYTLEYVFVKKHIRRGLMSLLVKTLIDTRKVLKGEIAAAEEHSEHYYLLEKRSLALKLSANAAYGFMASESIPCIAISESVCNIGRQALNTTVTEIHTWFSPKNPEYVAWVNSVEYNDKLKAAGHPGRQPGDEVHQAEVVYGDSVTGDTPILVRLYDGRVVYRTIERLGDNHEWEEYNGDKEATITRDAGVQVWTERGWTLINRVIRHHNTKDIIRVSTLRGCVDVTTDHSLLTPDAKKITPTQVDIGSELLHADFDKHSLRRKMVWQEAQQLGNYFRLHRTFPVPDGVMNADKLSQRAFLNAAAVSHHATRVFESNKLRAAGLAYLFCSLGCKIAVDCQGGGNYHVSEVQHTPAASVQSLTNLGKLSGYVYDLETENHHFGAGVGHMIVHNTDSVMIKFGVATLQESNILAEEAMRRCNVKFEALSPMKLDHEKEYYPFALVEKKTYSALKYSPFKYNSAYYTYNTLTNKYEPAQKGDYVPTQDTKGAETERRDKIGFVKRTLKRQWDIALWERDPEKATKYARGEVDKLVRGRIDMSELIKSQSTRLKYTSQTPASVIAEKSAARGAPIASGERVFYVRTKQIEKKSLKRKRLDADTGTARSSIDELQAEWERGSLKTSESVEDPSWVLQNKIPIDYRAHLLGDVVNAYDRAHKCFLSEEQRARVWEPLTSGKIRVDSDIQVSGPLAASTVKGYRCHECRVPLKSLPPLSSSSSSSSTTAGEVTIHEMGRRPGRLVLCDAHADQFNELKQSYETKIAETSQKCDALWSRCATCVGPNGDAEACGAKTCDNFWIRSETRSKLANQTNKLADIMAW